MMLVFETNGSLLHLFSSTTEVELLLETVDIENGEYEFCDHTGQRFIGEVVAPVTYLRAGSFHLRPDGEPDRAIVMSALSRARSLGRPCDGVRTLDDLRRAHEV